MAGLALAASLSIDSVKDKPAPAFTRSQGRPPSIEELDAIELPDYGLTNARLSNDKPAPTQKSSERLDTIEPQTPSELERSQPPTPKQEHAANIVPSWRYPSMNKWRMLAACLEYFGNGLNDAAPGALIPYIERWYGIGYALVSLIWITNAVGFIVAAFTTDAIAARLGRAKSLIFSEACMVAAYVIIACPVPFPVVVIAYLLLGFGNQINLGLNNVFLANLQQSSIILGIAHGSYGIGGIAGPLVATALVSNGVHWQRFYFIPIAVRVICMVSTGYTFWDFEKENAHNFSNSLEQLASRQGQAESSEPSKLRLIGKALKIRTTLIGAVFILAYQGAEVSESGWFISYLIDYRNGDPAQVGYVTSGFWAGITLGRFVLTHFAHRWGEKWFVTGLSIGVVVFQLLAWLVPNIIGSSGNVANTISRANTTADAFATVSVSILGLLLGPVYPCAQTVFVRLLDPNLQVFALGFISAMGSVGGAIVPFLTGLLAQFRGTFVLHPICIAAYAVMLGCWALLPRLRKRTE